MPHTCYATGTAIRTINGDVAIESLAIGDQLVTTGGTQRPVVWLGHRTVALRNHPQRDDALPVRILAHAFGPNQPANDLLVSPGHAIGVDCLGEVLVPASALVNGVTIIRELVDTITYWHVELDGHDIILAENLPAESYLEIGNRGFFVESAATDLNALPDGRGSSDQNASRSCRPVYTRGVVVDAIRDRLLAVAVQLGWRLKERDLHEIRLEVDGSYIGPTVRGRSLYFLLPSTAKTVWLTSPTQVPAAIGENADDRELGVCIGAMSIGDGCSATRLVRLDDPRLCDGFHDAEPGNTSGAQRWTRGRAHLPPSLWQGLRSTFVLRLDLALPLLPHWQHPVIEDVVDPSTLLAIAS